MSEPVIQDYRANLQGEVDSVALYEALAAVDKDPKLAQVYQRLAAVEQKHADAWAARLRESGQPAAMPSPSWRTRTLIWLARRFGAGFILPSIASLEEVDSHQYDLDPNAGTMAAEERSHARLLRTIPATPGGLEGSTVAQLEGRHRSAGGNALRAAVLGANDGLVSNLSLVMGVAGADMDRQAILITGFAGLLAGACSMALGEWLSVKSSRELYERQIKIEKSEIALSPDEEAEELSLIYQSRGLSEARAHELSTAIMQDEASALDTLSREELGIDPQELGGSAWEAAFTSFFLFTLGAIVPVLPYLFVDGPASTVVSVLFSIVGLFIIGAAITLFTGRTVLFSGTRQVLFGLVAAAVTFGLGRLLGVNIAG